MRCCSARMALTCTSELFAVMGIAAIAAASSTGSADGGWSCLSRKFWRPSRR